MHSDAVFYIGKTHIICQDYVTNFSSRNKQQIVLCDGCSSSEMVDVGARLLALGASDIIEDTRNFAEGIPDRTAFYHIANYIRSKYQHPLIMQHPTMFDATLLFITVDNDVFRCGIAGDGIFVLKEKSGKIVVISRDCQNIPDYLSYHLDINREAAYYGASVAITTNIFDLHTGEVLKSDVITPIAPAPRIFTFPLDEFEWAACLSDGVFSFQDSNRQEIPMVDVVKKIIEFKSYTGLFVQRRLNAFKKDCDKNGWFHNDDLSMGCIYFGDLI